MILKSLLNWLAIVIFRFKLYELLDVKLVMIIFEVEWINSETFTLMTFGLVVFLKKPYEMYQWNSSRWLHPIIMIKMYKILWNVSINYYLV